MGLFSDYRWDSGLDGFDRYNLFYGWNGSGKTTLSKLFACLEDGKVLDEFPSLEYDIVDNQNRPYQKNTPLDQKMRVFNQDYIQRNVQLVSGKANPIFILGEENKEIANQIKKDEDTLKELETEKSTKESEKKKAGSDKEDKFTEVAKIIGADLAGSSMRTYRKPDAKKDFEALTEKRILSASEVQEQRKIIKQEQKDKITIIELKVDLDLFALYKEVANICKETAEINVIRRLADRSDISEWVEKGLHFHTMESERCEFCDSKLPAGRIKDLLGHFNEADTKLKEKIDAKTEDLQEIIRNIENSQVLNKAEFYTDLQTQFASQAESYNQEKENYCAELSSMIEILNAKKQKTTEVMSFSRSLSNNLQTSLNSINKIIGQHNQRSDNFQTEKDKAFGELKKHYLSEISGEVEDLDKKNRRLSKRNFET